MATESLPAVGAGGFTDTDWETMWDGSDGIYNDFDGSAFAVTRVNATNSVTVGPVGSVAAVNGYFLRITATETISVPTGTGTYFLAVMYDPTLNVADGSGNAVPAGPCRLVVTTGAPSTAGGKSYLLLRKWTRSTGGASLTSLTEIIYSPHVGPNLSMDRIPASFTTDPPTLLVGMQYPVGTRIYEVITGEVWQNTINSDGGTRWKRQSIDGPYTFSLNGVLVSAGQAPAYYYTNNRSMLHLEGTVQRASGTVLTNTGNNVNLGTVDVAPMKPARFSCVAKLASTSYRSVQVLVDTDSSVTLYDTAGQGFDPLWVDLSGISYRVR